MDEDAQVAATEEQTEQIETEETVEQKPQVEAEEDTTDYKALAEQRQKAFEDQKKRAEKAEAKLKDTPKPKQGDDLSSKDILALSSLGISDEEDIEILQKAAKISGTSIAAAIKDPIVAGILKGKQEERKTATASSTGSSRRTPIERSPTALVDNFRKGVLPDPKDMDAFVKAKIGIK